jgi:hypothetical protein
MEALLFAGLVGLSTLTLSEPTNVDAPSSPTTEIVRRMDDFVQRHETDGIAFDPRALPYPTEVVRLTIVPQLLGYVDSYRREPSARILADVRERADYLVAHFDAASSGTAFDGLMGYALYQAYDVVGDTAYLSRAERVAEMCRHFPEEANRLDWGLMSALPIAEHYRRSGNVKSLDALNDILAWTAAVQNPDGSFPHYCIGSRDIHYTAWIAVELRLLHRSVRSRVADAMFLSASDFLERRIGPDGLAVYSDSCTTTGCKWYTSFETGCDIDYDTRSWVNEIGYEAYVFAAGRRRPLELVVKALDVFETDGGVPDKYAHIPPPSDPTHIWSVGDPSIIRTSLVFWMIAALRRPEVSALALVDVDPSPARLAAARDAIAMGPEGPSAGPFFGPLDLVPWSTPRSPSGAELEAQEPSPSAGVGVGGGSAGPSVAADARLRVTSAPGRVEFSFALVAEERARLEIYDAAGRIRATLVRGALGAGEHRVRWDGKDAAGRGVAPGVYFARLEHDGARATARFVWFP